eukprot:1339307-Amphidinium_carterae.1
MDWLWSEVMNRIERVHAYTKKDDPSHKAKTKENPKIFKVVPQSVFMLLCKHDREAQNEEKIGNYFEIGVTVALFQRDLFAVRRMLVALISKLPIKDKETFWQWYSAYGFRSPRYNT